MFIGKGFFSFFSQTENEQHILSNMIMDVLYLAKFSESKSETWNPRKCGKETEILKGS